MGNLRIYFAAEGSVIFCQAGGKKIRTVTTASSCSVTSDGKSVVVSDGMSQATVYSVKGEKITDFSLSEKMIGIKIKNGYCYAFSGRSITVYSDDGQKQGTHEVKSGALDFFVLDDGSILICYVSETKRIVP